MNAMTPINEKPPYIGLLNAISLAESAAGVYLEAWANATADEELAQTLRLVAARETSHGEVFKRRLCELGFELRQKPDPDAGARIARYANPKVSDLEKIGPEREERDTFADIRKAMADGAYDPMTCNLLGWYIAEEDDSGRRLRESFAKVRGRSAPASKPKSSGATQSHEVSADAQAIMACVTAGLAKLEKQIEKLAKARVAA